MSSEHDNNILPASAETSADQSTSDPVSRPSDPVSDQGVSHSAASDGAESNSAASEPVAAHPEAVSADNGGTSESAGQISGAKPGDDSLPQADGATSAVDPVPVTTGSAKNAAGESVAHPATDATAKPAREPRSKGSPNSRRESRDKSVPKAPARPVASDQSDDPSPDESMEHMDELMAQYASPARPAGEDQTVEGKVVAITEAGVVVDIGGKLEGLIPAQEMMEIGVALPFEPGQTIEVERTTEQKDGYAVLSYVRVHRRQLWDRIKQAFRDHAPMTGKVVEHIKGGLVVDIGVRAFLPASQIDIRPTQELEGWKDQEITVRVLKLNPKRGNVVISRRVLLEEGQKAIREALAANLHEGDVVRGKVKNIADYGVFVDLGGLDGLLHVSDLSWGRITNPLEAVKPGDEMEVKILKFDREKMRISLGRKQLMPDPWATVPGRFAVGARVHGQVVGLTDYGAFVQVEPGVEGLVHVSEMSWSRRMKHPSKMVAEGDEVEVVVLELKPEERRISLGLKQTMPDPWDAVTDRYLPGSMVTGRVRNVTDFGAFVEVEDGIEGLIHIGDISWTERVQHPSEKFKKGDSVEAKVLKVDPEHRRLSLGVKQLHDPVGDWLQHHTVGEIVHGKVNRLTTFGAFVELAEGVDGLCHISEIEERRPKGGDRDNKQPRDANRMGPVSVGQEYDFKVIKLEPTQRKISLSYRAAHRQSEQRDLESFRTSSKSSSSATIGDAIMAKQRLS
jgi:small subunit ribosomal protein S1